MVPRTGAPLTPVHPARLGPADSCCVGFLPLHCHSPHGNLAKGASQRSAATSYPPHVLPERHGEEGMAIAAAPSLPCLHFPIVLQMRKLLLAPHPPGVTTNCLVQPSPHHCTRPAWMCRLVRAAGPCQLGWQDLEEPGRKARGVREGLLEEAQ